MIPKIFIYEEGRLQITPEAFSIKELNDIIQKYDMESEPYLMYVDKMTNPESSYINYEKEEKIETIIYDITNTIGEFNFEDELIQPAIDRLEKAFTSRTKKYYDSLGTLMDEVTKYAQQPKTISDNKKDGNLDTINKMIKEGGATIKSYREVEKQVDEEIKTKMRGKGKLGRYGTR